MISALDLQSIGQRVQSHYSHRVAFINGGLGHAKYHARIFALRDGHAAGGFHRAHSVGAIIAHAGHDQSQSLAAKFLRH